MAFAVRDEDAGDTNVGTVAPIAPNTSFSSRDCGGHKFNEKCVELQYHISIGDFLHIFVVQVTFIFRGHLADYNFLFRPKKHE